jgi:hypothetical protein
VLVIEISHLQTQLKDQHLHALRYLPGSPSSTVKVGQQQHVIPESMETPGKLEPLENKNNLKTYHK